MKVDTQTVLPELAIANAHASSSKQIDKPSISLVENNQEIQKQSNVDAKVESEQNKIVELDREQLETMAQKLQDVVGSLNRGLEFSVDEDSGRDVIKVIDKNSGDTVRQYPSEEVLDLVASLSDAAGTFVNVKA